MQNSNLRRLLWEVIKQDNGDYKRINKIIKDLESSLEREYNQLDLMKYQDFNNKSILMQKIKIELIKIEINTIIDNKK